MMTDALRKALPALLAGETKLTAALSGGGDSVAMTDALDRLAGELGFTLTALHIHHGIRAASDEEERFVRDFCKTRRIPLTVVHADAPEHAKAHRVSLEQAARAVRYKAFSEYLTAHGGKIATAHHLDDDIETFFINLARGCGGKGLCGIPASRDGIIRPLLSVRKTDIIAYLQRRKLPFCQDESNNDTYYLRNFLRKEILPRLYARTDIDFAAGFIATAENLRAEQAFLDETAAAYLDETNAARLAALPEPALWRVLKARYPSLTRAQFLRLREKLPENFKEQLSGGHAVCQNGILRFIPQTNKAPLPCLPLESQTRLPNGKTVFLKEIHTPFTKDCIDCDTITQAPLFVRGRRSGDRFTLVRRGVTKTLKKLFSEDKVEDRDQRIVIADAKGRVVFVEGYGVSAPFTATDATRRALRVEIIQGESNHVNFARR